MLGDEGWSATGDLGAGLGVTFGFGDSEITLGLGIGLGGRLSVTSTEVIESISLTYDEAKNINKKSQGSATWGVANVTPLENGTYQANVTIGSGKEKIVTKQVVKSGKDGKIWMSENYLKEAIKVENL